MSMNKYMHPRNIYKSPPNFKQLALEYPEFRKFVTHDITGKVSLDFKNTQALKSLSCILLKKDFGLEVEIPLNKLIPTIPLRLNYILWLEDLLSLTGRFENITGVDIGTGASCVYPLIAAKKNRWCMIASDVDEISVNFATNNVEKNCLQDFIEIVKVDENVILKDIVGQTKYDFCLCNPPFFGNVRELYSNSNSRSLDRPKPKNSFCASVNEVVVGGGEVEFISKLINESKQLGTQLKIYTTMVGCKKNMPQLKKLLRDVKVSSFKETEFCQGNTTRWGLAWTFSNDFDLKTSPDHIKQGVTKVKSKQPLTYCITIEEANEVSLNMVRDCMLKLYNDLQMLVEEVTRKKYIVRYFITAYSNTWSNQRKKRREKLRNSVNLVVENNLFLEKSPVLERATSPGKRSHEELVQGTLLKKLKISGADEKEIFLKFITSLKLEHSRIILEIDSLNGDTNREYLHQILQYLKNNLKLL